eukprot:GHUV01037157.1.p1 GENE.GHUV01037157.1~~GHUV01037157.1.p1  ORF type:complete len:222 (+),score=50.35 GHUV01037157.1:687-1352(+)
MANELKCSHHYSCCSSYWTYICPLVGNYGGPPQTWSNKSVTNNITHLCMYGIPVMQCSAMAAAPLLRRYGPSLGNYGGLPQTWSNSNATDNITGYPGDNDPIDVLDISSIRAPIGGVYKVKVLGVLSMIDANESDWKVMVINIEDPQAATYSTILDVPKERLEGILQFYANYKQAEGKPKACFWPVAAPGSMTPTAPVCEVPANAEHAQYFHPKQTAVEVC